MNMIGQIIAYENGDLDDTEVIELFQAILDKNMLYSLQGSYGRQAQALIDAGVIAYLEDT